MRPTALARSPRRPFAAVALIACLAGACSGDKPTGNDPEEPPGECSSASTLQECLPSWQEFSPSQAAQAPEAAGEPAAHEQVSSLERLDEQGIVQTTPNITFVCTDRTYNFVDNPERAMSFNIDETVIWPGSLVQGRTHRDGASIGSLLQLPVTERAPLSLSLSFNNQDNTRVIDLPAYGTVSTAIGSMIGNASAEGLATASNIDFLSRTYSSEKQAALDFGMSGRYIAFEAKASGSMNRTTTTNTIAAKFVQQMYIAGVTQPSTPGAFFSDAFTPTRYAEHAALGRLGPTNPPLYVSRIGYGRMMVFAMTAKAEASEIQAALRLAYEGVGFGGSASLSARQAAILSQSELRITQVGGDQSNAINAIRSGQLADYFTNTAPLTSAAPLWFELKSLTGEVAMVSETGTYTETTCVPRLPGTFDYEPEIAVAIPFAAGTQRQVRSADVNGDGRMDLVYNERGSAPSLNRVHVALASAGGSYSLASPATSPAAPAEGWQNFQMLVVDVDGDGRDDLSWNHRGTNNVVYTAMSTGDGGFHWRARQVHPAGGWTPYEVTTGDLNGDGRSDLLFTGRGATSMRLYFGLAQADSTFSLLANFIDRPGDYRGYTPPTIGDFDNDGNGDIVVNALVTTHNSTYVARFTPTSATTGTLTWTGHLRTSDGWQDYTFGHGDIDGANGHDLVFAGGAANVTHIHRARNNGSAGFSTETHQSVAVSGAMKPFIGDFNDDGRADVLLTRRTATLNELQVGYGTSDGQFSFPAGAQAHPNSPTTGWQSFDQLFVGDVNGDGKADIVWTNTSGDARIYVALAR